MTLDVGAGILEAMLAIGDRPMRDSKWLTNKDGTTTERGYGALATYIATNARGVWEVVVEARNAAPGAVATLLPTIDVSSWQPTSLTDLIGKAHARHVVIRLYQQTLEHAHVDHSRAQIASARANAVAISGYSWLYTGEDPAQQVNEPIALAASVGLKLPALYVDLEEFTDGSLPTGAEVLAAVAAIRAASVQPGIYTRRDIWERIGSPDLTGCWLWVALWNGQATLDVESFGGARVVGHQYADHLPSGESLDLSVFSSAVVQ